MENYLQLGLYLIGVFGVIAAMLLGYFLGEKGKSPVRDLPYESGVKTFAKTELHFFVRYYLFAMFFLIFDLETIFLLTYATVVKLLGIPGLIQIMIFIGFLFLALLYLWRAQAFSLSYKEEV